MTEQILGSLSDVYDGSGDYLLVCDDQNNIVSRWFIIETNRTRGGGQYNAVLRRDVVVDNYDDIISSTMYIEKANVKDDDPAIYNSEGVSVNQIKTNEYLLQDISKSAWIVGYFNRDYASESPLSITYSNPTTDYKLSEGQTIQQFINLGKASDVTKVGVSFKYSNTYKPVGSSKVPKNYHYEAKLTQDDQFSWQINALGSGVENPYSCVWMSSVDWSSLPAKQKTILDSLKNSIILSQARNYVPGIFQPTKFEELMSYNGKIVESYDGSQKYQIVITRTKTESSLLVSNDLYSIDNTPSIKTYISNAVDTVSGSPKIYVDYEIEEIKLSYKAVSFETFQFSIGSNRVHLNDAPYDMFCVPYKEGGLNFKFNISALDIQKTGKSMDAISSLTAVQSIVEQMGKDNVYDVQLLPFCPLQGWYLDENDVFSKDIKGKPTEDGAGGFTSNEVIYSGASGMLMIFSTSSQGTILSDQIKLVNSQTKEEVSFPIKYDNKKIANECDMWRLCSPNYNGQFQFNATKMNGITGFNVDYTYLPYSPYIHVNPNFSGLYGEDFDDARGLVCQGDFSISYLSDAWVNYQVQNKNYANIFARGTENLELTQSIQRKQQIAGIVTGTVGGAVSGATTGALVGGGLGALAGALVGGASSAIGGSLDLKYSDQLRQEALDYRQDLFNYQLDNIKALPDSVAKVTAYTRNNKIFPVLEYYTCTDVEKRAIANKVAYNGMTVMRIGSIYEFLDNDWSYGDIESRNYIKGQLIHYPNSSEDYHIVNTISGEMYKGVYFK